MISLKAKKELLENGKVLNTLVKRFYSNRNLDNLEAIFLCLIDSDLSVPIDSNMKKKDIKELEKLNKDDNYVNKKSIEIRPDWLRVPGEDQVFLPIFSNEEEATPDYSKGFLWISLTLDDCLKMVEDNKNCKGLVLNAFTNPIEIEGELLDALKTMLKETREVEKVIKDEKEEGIEYPNIDDV